MAVKPHLLLLLLFITPFAAGMDTRLVDYMNLTIVQQGSVRAVGGELKYLIMNLSVPIQTDYQTAVSDRPVTKLDDGNSIVTIESKNPTNPFGYKVTSYVGINTRSTTYLPSNYQLDYSELRYTQPSWRVQSDDAQVKNLARTITANSSDDFERISKLALWVNQQLTYDLKIAGLLKDTKWILQNKRGVCTEYSTLFIALSRSIGIPARFVSGLAYDEDRGGWVGHSWAEVFIGRWVPVDPTWTPVEVGYLDATHLEISKMLDNETFDNVYALTSQNARLEWPKSDTSRGADIGINSFKEAEPNSDYQIESAAEKIGFGVKTLVIATIYSDEYQVVSLNLTSCTSSNEPPCNAAQIIKVDDGGREVVLRPGERKILTWVVNSDSRLSSSCWYSCPLVLNSDRLEPKTVEIQAVSTSQSINFNAFLEKSELRLGENQTVYVDVGVARKYEGRLYVTHDDYFNFQQITKSGRYSFSLKPTKVGLNKLYVATSLGGVKELDFFVTESGGIGVNVNVPQFIPAGASEKIYVNLTSNETGRGIRIIASAGSSKEAKQISLHGNASVEFPFNFSDSSVRNVTVSVASRGFLREFVKPVTVYNIPNVNLTKMSFKAENGSVRADLLFSIKYEAEGLIVSVDGSPVAVMQDGSASVVLTPGTHVLRVNYSDVGGLKYGYAQILDVPLVSENGDKNWETYIKYLIVIIPVVLYFGSLLILAIAVVVLKKIEKDQ